MTLADAPIESAGTDAIPRPGEVDCRFLEAVLASAGHRYALRDVTVEPIGAGQIGETVRFHLGYRPGAPVGPATIVGKFASTDPTSLAVARTWSLYEREVRFYAELGDRAGIALPAFYGGRIDRDGNFILLLEDLAPARPGDQFAGLADDITERAVREAARLHAAFWGEGERDALAWLDTAACAQPFYTADVFRSAWPGFRDRYGDRLSADHHRVCDAFAEHYDIYDRPRGRARCVTHNDYRPDNMLFDEDRLVVVDWQSVALGTGAVDIAYLIGGGYSPEARRAIEPRLMQAYLDELRTRGVDDYDDAAFAADYRHFTFAGINVAVGAAMLVQRTERGDRLFLTMLDRHVAHVLDHDALSLLRDGTR